MGRCDWKTLIALLVSCAAVKDPHKTRLCVGATQAHAHIHQLTRALHHPSLSGMLGAAGYE